MPYLENQIKTKTFAIKGNSLGKIFEIYEEVLKSAVSVDAGMKSTTEVRPGWSGFVLKHSEKILEYKLGATIRKLPTLEHLKLDPPAHILVEAYADELRQLLLYMGKTPAEIEKEKNITDKYVLVYEIAIRFVSIALCTDMEAARDAASVLGTFERFISKLVDEEVLHKNDFFSEQQLSAFDKFFITRHPKEWMPFLYQVAESIRVLHSNKTALTDALTYLTNMKYAMKCHIVARINQNVSKPDMSSHFIDITLKKCEQQKLTQQAVSSSQTVTRYSPIVQRVQPEKQENLQALYEALEEIIELEKSVGCADMLSTSMGWFAVISGSLRLDKLATILSEHDNTYRSLLDLKFNDPILGTISGKNLAAIPYTHNQDVQNLGFKSASELRELHSPDTLRKLALMLQPVIGGLVSQQASLGHGIFNVGALNRFLMGSSPNQLSASDSQLPPPASAHVSRITEKQEFSFTQTRKALLTFKPKEEGQQNSSTIFTSEKEGGSSSSLSDDEFDDDLDDLIDGMLASSNKK